VANIKSLSAGLLKYRNDFLNILLNKFPKEKGETVRGKFGYKYLKINRAKQFEHIEGCFEIKVD
jgi:hypothetical protein